MNGRARGSMRRWSERSSRRSPASGSGVPAVGLETIEIAIAGGAAVLAVEAGRVVALDREALVRAADAANVALVGVAGEGGARAVPPGADGGVGARPEPPNSR